MHEVAAQAQSVSRDLTRDQQEEEVKAQITFTEAPCDLPAAVCTSNSASVDRERSKASSSSVKT